MQTEREDKVDKRISFRVRTADAEMFENFARQQCSDTSKFLRGYVLRKLQNTKNSQAA